MDEIPEAARAARRRADDCLDERRFVDAILPAEEAVRICPDWAAPWWILGAGYKHARRWEEALHACDRAISLDPENAEGPHWNAGIAATALGRWERARAAWTALGIELPAGSGPIEMKLGATPIRLSPNENPEVVWCDRIDPCRARIINVPLPESGRRYQDLVLHDGEPRGKRRFKGGRPLSVFDELDLLEPSPFGTWEIVVNCPTREELDEVDQELSAGDLCVEDWTTNFRVLCEKCSLGDPDEHEHDHPEPDGWKPERTLGVAARSEADLRPLRRARLWWRRGVVSVRRVL